MSDTLTLISHVPRLIIKKLEPYRKIGLRIIIPFPEIRIV